MFSLAAASLLVFGALSAAAGIGGGAIIVVIFLVAGLSERDAVPLSKAVVFAGTIASLSVAKLMRKRSTSPDYELAAAIVPPALAGTLLGVALNHVVPPTVILVLLIATLCWTGSSTLQTLRKQLREEQEPGKAADAANDDGVDDSQSFCFSCHFLLLAYVVFSVVAMSLKINCYEAKRENLTVPCESQLLRRLFGDWHDHPERGFLTGAHGWHAAVAPGLVCLMLCAAQESWYHKAGFIGKTHSHHELALCSAVAFIAGTLAGLVGIGGGLIFAPFLLYRGVQPARAVATSTFCVLFTSSSTTLQYTILGRVLGHELLWYAPVYVVACFIGTYMTNLVAARRSLVTGTVFVAVLVSAALTLGQLYERTKVQAELHSPVPLLEMSHTLLRRRVRRG